MRIARRAPSALRRPLRALSSSSSSRAAGPTLVRAAVARTANAPFSVEDVELRAPRGDEVLVRVVATGICHTDAVMKSFLPADEAAYEEAGARPVVLGHEGVGVVEAVGGGVTGVAPGDHVVMTYASCGTCPQCAHGKPSYCDGHGPLNFGGTHPDGSLTMKSPGEGGGGVQGSFFQQSSFATHALASERNVVRVTGDVPLDTLAPLGCGVQTGAGAVMNTLQARPGSTLAVFGCGAVGLSAVMAAQVAGLSRVVAVDVTPSRLEQAAALGATHTVDGRSEGVAEQIRELTGGGVHYSLDTSGVPSVLRSAFESLRVQGVCGMIAPGPAGTEVAVDTMTLLHGRSLRGVVQGDSVPSTFIPQMIGWWQQGRFPFDSLLTTYEGGLDDINRAMADTKEGGVIKPVLRL